MIYDINTKNISFLRVSADLRKRGIKNNKFMLTLYDESLVGVDPHSENLNPSQKIAIFKECTINVWYYLREVIRIPGDGKLEGVPYKLNLGNMTMTYLKTKNKNQIVILPRQFGKTMGQLSYDTWILLFAATNATIMYSNKEFKDSKEALRKIKNLKERLPLWLTDLVADKGDKDNEEVKLFAKKNNKLMALAAANSDDTAEKLGRGMTSSNLYFDEFAFLVRNELIYLAAAPAWSTASQNAKKFGTPYGITITTTPNNRDTKHGAYAMKILNKAAVWDLQCLDMNDQELDEFVELNSKNGFIWVQFTYSELGKDDKWLQRQLATFQGDLAKVKREFLLEWPKSTETSVFKDEQLDKIYQFVRKPITSIKVNGYFINLYEQIDVKINYIITCDIAGGLSEDNTALLIVAPDDFRVVGEFRSPRIDTDSARKLIEVLMKDWFRNAILIIERNSYGLPLLDILMKDREIEPRMVREEREVLGQKTQKDGFVVKRGTKNILYGIDTNSKTRKLMFELLPEIVESEYDKIISENLYKDIQGLEKKKNGKIEHSDTSYDDTLMAYLIFRYALHHGKCLRDRFKINSIPNKNNIKMVSSSADIMKIESIIKTARDAEEMSSVNTEVFRYIQDQQQKMGERSEQMSSINRILDYNK
jgi:hypothetical protein